MSDSDAVRAANDAFYAAFEALDFDAMAACWAQRPGDVCVHPGWDPLFGWDDIRQAWRAIFANTEFMRVVPDQVHVEVVGDVARLSCVENLYSISDEVTVQAAVACTHLFHRVDGAWKLVLHHGSPIAAAQTAATGDDDEVN